MKTLPKLNRRRKRAGSGLEPILKTLSMITRRRKNAEQRWTRGPFTMARSYHLDRLLEAERSLHDLLTDEKVWR